MSNHCTFSRAVRSGCKFGAAVLFSTVLSSACGSSEEKSPAGETTPDAGTGPSEQGGGLIYASVSGADEVLVIDDETHEIVSEIPVGEGPAILLATPNFEKLYTANWANDTISSIKTADESVVNIPGEGEKLSGRPYVIAMSPDGKRLYAGLYSNEIIVIDTETDEVIDTWPTPDLPASLMVSPDGETLYVATIPFLTQGTLRAVSTADGSLVQKAILVGSVPAWITIGKDGSRVYTLNFMSDDVTVVDTAAWEEVTTVSTGANTRGIIGNVTPDGSRLYVTNFGSADLIAIDTASNEIVQTIELTGKPVGVNFSPDGKRVYTTDFGPASADLPVTAGLEYLTTGNYTIEGDGQISVFDVETGEPVGEKIVTGPGPTSIVVRGAPSD